ncbi:MAG: methionyl-tRNA formyltransferase, partial [bacterium]|nr:methionyl-tRNA formyltransferase [bacterium]
ILLLPASGSLNVHPSLLPRWRGPAPIQWAILEGDQMTGATIFCMDEKVDHGPVLTQEALAIAPEDTAETLEQRLSALGAGLLIRTLPDWLAGKITPRPQDHARATHSTMFTREDGLIDWKEGALRIERRVRALAGWPGTHTYVTARGRTLLLKVRAVRVVPSPAAGAPRVPGTVLHETARLLVATGDGVLEVLTLQPEGKRPMSGAQFLNGHRDLAASVLTRQDS